MSFELPKLSYSYDALEPHIDKETMEIHHSKHHAGYTNNLNKAVQGTDLEDLKIEELILHAKQLPDAVRNNAGGFYNHNLFFNTISPNGGGTPKGKLLEKINETFGSFDSFKEEFFNASMSRFGSGWTWLVLKKGNLEIITTPNQDNPIMKCNDGCKCGSNESSKKTLLLGLDVWEHAYYLKYQNRRNEYINAFFNVVDWDKVGTTYSQNI